jgi:predicted PurR-regulated permease PerM
MEEAALTKPSPSGVGGRLRPPTPRVAVLIGGLVVVGVLLFAAGSAVRPFVVGLLLAYLLDPLVDRFARVGMPRWLAVLIVYAIVIGALTIAVAVAIPPLVQQIATFGDELPLILGQIQYQLAHLNELYDQLGLPIEARGWADEIVNAAVVSVRDLNVGLLQPVVTSVTSFVGSLFGYLILPAWLFFILKDRAKLRTAADRALPVEWRPDAWAIAGIVHEVFGKWVRGQLVLGGVVGIASFIGLTILGIYVDPIFGRFAVLLAIVAAIGELIPIIGPIISAVPAVLLGLTAGVGPALAALILYFVIQQVENNVLVPKIQSDAIDLHPSIVIAALVIGGAIFGLLGAILALPVTAAGRDVFKYAFRRAGVVGGAAPPDGGGSSDAEIQAMQAGGARFAVETGKKAVR